MIDEMYFVAKGTVIFCLDKRYGEKEIREIKKNNNFGEIEMCLNEKLSFNIKIKSRNCELFVLKKNDFLRLSVNFKEFIESFLHKSLMKYLKFNEEKNQMIKEFDSLINGEEGSDDEEGDKASESIDEVGGSSSEGESKEEDSDEDGDTKKQKDKTKKEMSQKSIKSKNSKKDTGEKNNESKSESDSQQSSSSSSSSSNKTQEINDNNNNNEENKDKDKDEDGDSTYRAK